MVLKVGEVKWKLHFRTEIVQNALWDVVIRCALHSGPCILSQKEPVHCVNTALEGEAKCSKKDNFNRRVGNRLALTKALKNLPLVTRESIWRAYWQKVRRPKESSAKFKQRLLRSAA